ncbi:hypothetical protein Tco_0364525 [Tanacetum coccineum]
MLVQGQILQGERLTIPVDSPTQTHVVDEAASTGVDVRHGGAATTVSRLDAGHGNGKIDKTPSMANDSPLPRVHTLGSDEGRMQPIELMELVTKLSDRVVSLETGLQQTKKVYGAAYTKLIKKVKSSRKDPPSKKGMKIAQIEEFEELLCTIVAQTSGRHDQIDKMEADFEFTTAKDVSTANVSVSTTAVEISTASPKVKTVGVSVDDTKTKIQQEQERLGFEEAQRLQEQFDEEERQRIVSVQEEAMKRVNTFTLMESDDTVLKVVVGSSKRSIEEKLGEESSKSQKIGEGSESAEESKDKESDELSQEQLQ